jgi:protein CpxP
MNSLAKNKALVSIIIFLLITNIAMLFFFLELNKPVQRNGHGRDQNGMSGMLQKDVGFTKVQLDSYQALRKEQFEKGHPLFDDLRKAKMDFYNLIYTAQVSDSSVNKAADLIAEKQEMLDLQMFKHLKMVRNICTPDQLQKFDSTIKKVLIRMTGRPGKETHGH